MLVEVLQVRGPLLSTRFLPAHQGFYRGDLLSSMEREAQWRFVLSFMQTTTELEGQGTKSKSSSESEKEKKME